MKGVKKDIKQKEIGRIKLSDTQELVVSVVDDEKLDLRIWLNERSYKGYTTRGLRFYWFDGVWEEFKKLIKKADKIYDEVA